MSRSDYQNGRGFNFSKWNIFANLSNNIKDVHNSLSSSMSWVETSYLTPTKTSSEFLGVAVESLGNLLSDVNTSLDSTGLFSYVYSFTNEENVTENSTFSWYDNCMQLGQELLNIHQEQKITDPAYIPSSSVKSSNIDIINISKNYVLNGNLRFGDLDKSYITTSSDYTEYSLPSGEILRGISLIYRNNTDFDTSFETSRNWDVIETRGIDNQCTFDGTNYINYTAIFIKYEDGDINDEDDDHYTKYYVSVWVDVYSNTGVLQSSNQYNQEINQDDIYLPSVSGNPDSFRRDIYENYEGKIVIDDNHRGIITGFVTSRGRIDADWDDSYAYKAKTVRGFVGVIVANSSSVVDSREFEIFVRSATVQDFETDYRYDLNYEYDNTEIKTAQFNNDIVVAGAMGAAFELITDDENNDLVDVDSASYAYVFSIGVNNGAISYNQESVVANLFDNEENPSISLYAFETVDNITPSCYFSIRYQQEESPDLESSPQDRMESKLCQCTSTGINVLDYQNFTEDRNDYSLRDYDLKLSPNYQTNTVEIHWRQKREINNVFNYYYNTSESEYNKAVNTDAYIKDGRISDGADWYGATYTFQRQNNTPTFVAFDRQRKYYNMDYNNIYTTTDGIEAEGNSFTIYHSLPKSTYLLYIPNYNI